jgi:hypothetical protein
MRASAEKLYSVDQAVPRRAARTRIALTSPILAYTGAAIGSIAVWVGLFKLIFG